MERSFTYALRAKPEENIPYNYKVVDIDAYNPTKPIVLTLGGSGTTDDHATNGNIKILDSMLGVFSKDVDIIGVNYNKGLNKSYIDDNCTKLVKNLFVPYIESNGNRLDIDTACKNMRNITIFAHCRGVDGIMSRVVPILRSELIKLSYDDAECKQIISQIVMVAYGADYYDTIREVKGVYFLSFSDDMFISGAVHAAREFLDKVDTVNMVKTDRDLLKQANPRKTQLTQVVKFLRTHKRVYNTYENNMIRLFGYGVYETDGEIWQLDHSIIGLSREDDWSKHKSVSSVGDCISRCFASALCNSVANSIQNNQSTQHIEFDMNDLHKNINNICKIHNYEQTKSDNTDLQL